MTYLGSLVAREGQLNLYEKYIYICLEALNNLTLCLSLKSWYLLGMTIKPEPV